MSVALPELLDVEEVRDRFSRRVAIVITIATLGAALVGYLQAIAGRDAAIAATRAQRYAVQSMAADIEAHQEANQQYDTFTLGQQQRQRSLNALQQLAFAEGDESVTAELEQELWSTLADDTAARLELDLNGPLGPANDPIFPFKYYASKTRQALQLGALQDAANAESSAWDEQAGQLGAVLTVFAVALYLLGSSLAMAARIRPLLAAVGTGLAAIGGVWAVTVAIDRPARAPDEAAAAFADGKVALASAASTADYQMAVGHFERSLSLRPDFAQAHLELAGAIFSANSPQTAGGYLSITRPEALRNALSHLESARALGLESSRVLGDLGFLTYVLGVQTNDDGALGRSIDFTQRAIELNPTDPVEHYNLGVAHLALRQSEAARAALTTAVHHTLYSDFSTGELRGQPGTQEQWVAGVLTDLELLAAAKPDLAAAVLAEKEFIVGSVSRGDGQLGAIDGDEQVEVELTLFPAEVQASLREHTVDEAADVLSIQWYQEVTSEQGVLGWAVVPQISSLQATVGVNLVSFLAGSFPPACLPNGQYRAEIYVNGKLVTTATDVADFPNIAAASVYRDLNLSVCRPPDWVPSASSVPGVVQGHVSPDGSRGVFALRLEGPASFADDPEATVADAFASLASISDSFALLPATEASIEDLGRDDDYGSFFLGLDGAETHTFGYPDGTAVVAAGVDTDGTVVMGFVFGPDAWFSEEGLQPYRIYESISPFL